MWADDELEQAEWDRDYKLKFTSELRVGDETVAYGRVTRIRAKTTKGVTLYTIEFDALTTTVYSTEAWNVYTR
jgi:hypothetical protein